MTADAKKPEATLRALADRLDIVFGTKEAAAIIRTLADLQEPARYALRREKGPLRESQLAAIVKQIVEVGDE